MRVITTNSPLIFVQVNVSVPRDHGIFVIHSWRPVPAPGASISSRPEIMKDIVVKDISSFSPVKIACCQWDKRKKGQQENDLSDADPQYIMSRSSSVILHGLPAFWGLSAISRELIDSIVSAASTKCDMIADDRSTTRPNYNMDINDRLLVVPGRHHSQPM